MIETTPRSGFIAQLPIYTRKVFGKEIICLPPLTRTLGPLIMRTSNKHREAQPSFRVHNSLMNDLISQLPEASLFDQFFDPDCSNLLEFYLNKFVISVVYTFRISDCLDINGIWESLRDKVRHHIRRASQTTTVETSSDVDKFLDFFADSVKRGGRVLNNNSGAMRRVLKAAVEHNVGQVLFCLDLKGRTLAALFLVWDHSHCYYLLSMRDHQLSGNGAVSRLLWEAIQFAGSRGLCFDFDAFATTAQGRFLAQFGGQAVPRWRVRRMPPLYRALTAFQSSGWKGLGLAS